MTTRYLKLSRESQVMQRVAETMNRVVDRAYKSNPLPPGEERIDPRTANKRLQQIPPDDLYKYYEQHG